MCKKTVEPTVDMLHQSEAELDSPSTRLAPLDPLPCVREGPAPPARPSFSVPSGKHVRGMCSPPANIPLHHAQNRSSVMTPAIACAIRTLLTYIDICVVIITMHIATTEASGGHSLHRKRLRMKNADGVYVSPNDLAMRHESKDDAYGDLHVKQLMDLVAWHIEVLNTKWYVKPRSTCWFEEYLFSIYTPDMFYDILRIRRRTFDRLVQDLRPFIQGQHTHWRQPIGVEKKVVVTLFKLMHGVCIPLVADKAAIGKSTVHEILRQVCSAISIHFGHLVAWPTGRRLMRVATAFQSKQGLPNCIGAIDGSHIYISAPSNTIVATDHRNHNKSFSILLQAVVDSKCYFTSINTGPPSSLHDSAHFKSTELYRKVEEGIMGGFHDDPLSWEAGLPFPPYIVADRGYPMLSWCIPPFKRGPMGVHLTRDEVWFNRKHSSTRMSVERGFGILKARFKEIGTKSSLKLNFLPTVVHCCCVLHNILLASKDRTLDQILADCQLAPMDDNDMTRREEEEVFQPPRPMGLVSEDRALLEGQMARDDILDYLVRVHNADHMSKHPRMRRS